MKILQFLIFLVINHKFGQCFYLGSNSDPEVTRLRIQLKKFCKLNHLPTTISDEREYNRLRNGITGGLSNVMHRRNIRGETHINRLHYDIETNKVISRDTPNIVTHVIGDDFNSLYPSSFSSEYHSLMSRMLLYMIVTEVSIVSLKNS